MIIEPGCRDFLSLNSLCIFQREKVADLLRRFVSGVWIRSTRVHRVSLRRRCLAQCRMTGSVPVSHLSYGGRPASVSGDLASLWGWTAGSWFRGTRLPMWCWSAGFLAPGGGGLVSTVIVGYLCGFIRSLDL